MKGLLLKDAYTLLKQTGIFVLMIAFFALFGGATSTFAVVYAGMLPITALAYDERSKWDSLAAMMPYSKADIVLSKYLLGYIGILFAALLSGAAQYVVAALHGAAPTAETLASLLMSCCVALVMLGLNLPVMFKLGVEKGRVAFFVLIALTVMAGMLGSDWLLSKLAAFDSAPVLLLGICGAGTLAFSLVSLLVSIALYKTREA